MITGGRWTGWREVPDFGALVDVVAADTGLSPGEAESVLQRLRWLMVDGEERTEPQLMGRISTQHRPYHSAR